jgi:hypothetical protein
MAKQKLFPERIEPTNAASESPHERFTDFATKILAVPKTEIDKREQRWRGRKSKSPRRS